MSERDDQTGAGDRLTDQALRDLDPAPVIETDSGGAHDTDSAPADDTVERILTEEPLAGDPAPGRPSRRRVWLWLVVVPVAVMVAAAILATLLFPVAQDDPPPDVFDSWSVVPTPVAGAEAVDAARACRERWRDWAAPPPEQPGARQPGRGESGSGRLDRRQVAAMSGVLTERRGVWVDTLLQSETFQASCLYRDETPGSFAPESVPYGGGASRRPDRGPGWPAQLAVQDTVSTGTLDGRGYTQVTGRLGEEVEAVMVELADGRRVAATLGEGRYVAWWPAPTGRADAEESASWQTSYTLTDGTVREMRTPSGPTPPQQTPPQ